ncbi:MAG: phage replisome organizer N-terminal domain-containing protein [Paraclostridium sp.]
MAKKYYWLKLKEDFFRQKEIKKLRKVAGGDTYTVIYLKMLLIAMNNDNKIYFEGIEDDFSEELALELDEDSDNVKMTLAFLQNQNLIEMINEDEFLLPYCKDITGTDKTSTDRVRKHRLKKKEEQKKLEGNVTCNVTCNVTRNNETVACNKNETLEKEKEKEKEKELEIRDRYIDKDKSVNQSTNNNLKQFKNLYEQNIGLINGISAEWIIEISETIEVGAFKKAIEIATDRNKCNQGYVKGIISNWISVNALTLQQVESYEKQKWNKEVKSDVRVGKRNTETEGSRDDRESEEARRAELLRKIQELGD